MTYLIVTNNEVLTKVLSNEIKNFESSAKIITTDFKISNGSKILKSIDDLSLAILFEDNNYNYNNKEIAILSNFCGFMIANNISIATNIKFLKESSIIQNDLFIEIESKNSLINYIKTSYDTISKKDITRSAKRNLLKKGIPFTPDCFAYYISKNKTAICNLFLNAGIDVNSKDDSGTPMLNIAVRNDNLTFVKKIVELGADINVTSEDRGYTPVMDAVWRGNEEITKFLIKKGADLNTISKEGQSNLVLAVGADRYNICKLLVQNGSDPDVKDMMGMSAYNYATLFKKESIVEILKPYHKE